MSGYTYTLPASTHLGSIDKEAVEDVDGSGAVHDGEEEGEEPAETDHGQDVESVLQ